MSRSFNEYKRLLDYNGEFTPEERNNFNYYLNATPKFGRYEDFLDKKLFDQWKSFENYLSNIETPNEHQNEAIKARNNSQGYNALSETDVKKLVYKSNTPNILDDNDHNYGFASVVSIIVITLLLIGVLVLVTVMTF